MRVRVELRRFNGAPIPRFRPQEGYHGRLESMSKEVEGRTVRAITVRCEPKQGYPDVEPPGPVLFEPVLLSVQDDELRFQGWERVDRAWHVQQWDCFFL